MNFWQRLLGRKESEAYSVVAYGQEGRAVFTELEYAALAKEGYQKNAIAYRCVNMLASACSDIPVILYRKPKSKRSKLQELPDHEFLSLLTRPNPLMPGSTYWDVVVSHLQLSGNAFIHAPRVVPGKPAQPKELWPLRPDTVKVLAGRFGMPSGYEVSDNGKTVRVEADGVLGKPGPMLQLKLFHPLDPWYGMSPIQAAAYSIDQHNESGKWNVALLQNSARPSGLLTIENETIPERQKAQRDAIRDQYQGSHNAGKLMVLHGAGVKFQGLSFAPKDMEWIESKHTSARDIALAFGVPPQMLGIPGDNTYANYQEARQAFWIETVLPLFNRVLGYHTQWGNGIYMDDQLCLGYDKDQLDALTPSRTALWGRVQTATHLTTNEKRVATGYEERDNPEYDEVLVGSGQVPLGLDVTEGQGDVTADALAQENGEEMPEDEEADLDEEGEEDADESEDEEADTEGKTAPRAWGYKAFGKLGVRERRSVWLAANRKRRLWEKRFARELKRAFIQEAERVALAVRWAESADAAESLAKSAIDQGSDRMTLVVAQALSEIGRNFGEATIRGVKSSHLQLEQKDRITDLRFNSFLTEWVSQHTADRVTKINRTTKRLIGKAIQESFAAEEGIPEMAKRIRGIYSKFSGPRATLIARTETVSASNSAMLGAVKATGIPNLVKEWISSNDGRSRDGDPESTNHREQDGERKELSDKFEVWSVDGTDLMEGPGDQEAPVDQIANCRCTLGFVEREAQQ